MKYFVRAVKYFFYFVILCSAIIAGLVLIGAVERDINSIFEDGYASLWKIAIFFALVAAVYPKVGFIVREVAVDKPLAEIRNRTLSYFRERGYELEQEDGQTLSFRLRSLAGRLPKMCEDRLTLRRCEGGYTLEGLRKDAMRYTSGLEHILTCDTDVQETE